ASSSVLTLFSSAFNQAVALQHAVALWAQPGSENFHLLIDRSPDIHTRETSWNSNDRGFILHSFLDKAGSNSWLLKPDLLFQLHGLSVEDKQHIQDYTGIEQVSFPFDTLESLDFSDQEKEQSDYTCKVEHLLEEFKKGTLKKIVLARNKKVKYPVEKSPMEAVLELRKAYPNAFISVAYHPAAGCWVGASPELLVSSDEEGVFRTVALAGTQTYNPHKSLREHTWNGKEIEEQAFVARYIVNCFKSIRHREYEEEGPKNYLSGNLIHLCTNYKIDAKALGIENLPDLLLPLLHPTSATCGTPKEKALELILQYEHTPRKLYTGFWGTLNIGNQSAVYVNLRCAQLFANGYSAYAGAGITADSIPANEWTETEHKLKAIQKIWESNS
ncbi:MAG TPA: chorismate-binding protein, partial [Cytophagaceae bacterium]|nr:chorismate-binding protein [Cytophagaceae bacterium]